MPTAAHLNPAATRHAGDPHGWRALAASLSLHAILLGLFILQQIDPPDAFQEPIPVEVIIDQGQEPAARPAPLPASPHVAEPLPSPHGGPPAAPAAPRPATPSVKITATKLFSAQILLDPRSRRSRETLAKLVPAARLEQICNLEAMAQIEAHDGSAKPDKVLAYAFEPVRLDGVKLIASGAAFHSGREWRRIAFTCGADGKSGTVRSFEFTIGEAIPRRQWEDHFLSSGADAD